MMARGLMAHLTRLTTAGFRLTHPKPLAISQFQPLSSFRKTTSPRSYSTLGKIHEKSSIYKPLDASRREIRVLWLLPPKTTATTTTNNSVGANNTGDSDADSNRIEDEPIRGELETVSLLDNPAYATLSYAWGPPESDHCRIVLNGQPFEIRLNLHNCLLTLRRNGLGIKGADPSRLPDLASDPVGHLRGIPLWIDAICINQDDISERNSQVALMGQVFRGARGVVSWLSEEERWEESSFFPEFSGLRLVHDIAQEWQRFKASPTPQEAGPNVPPIAGAKGDNYTEETEHDTVTKTAQVASTTTGTHPAGPDLTSLATRFVEAMPQFWRNKDATMALMLLFHNRYWQRTWIVQELVLADPASHVYMSKDVTLTEALFDEFAECISLMLGEDDPTSAGGLIPVSWAETYESVLSRAETATSQDDIPAPSPGANTADTTKAWWYLRLALKDQVAFRKIIQDIQQGRLKPGWLFILYVAHTRACTDPRDAVYGLMQLIHHQQSSKNGERNNKTIVPDYADSISSVYMTWALRTLKQRMDLELLIYAGRPDNTPPIWKAASSKDEKGPGLPSWVPDLFTLDNNYFTQYRAIDHLSASEKGQATSFIVGVTRAGYYLQLRARLRAVIASATQLCPDPNWPTQQLLEIAAKFCGEYLRSHPGPYPAGKIPPLQALMRLIMNRQLSRLDPAELDPATGESLHKLAFAFAVIIRMEYEKVLRAEAETAGSVNEDELSSTAASVLGLDLDGEDYAADYAKAMFPGVDVRSLMGWEHVDAAFLDVIPAPGHNVIANMSDLVDHKRWLFVTEGGLVGHGPNGIRVGDLIYEVEHCPLPLVFRPEGVGDDTQGPKHVTLLGGCEIIGIGDAFDDGRNREYDELIIH
jgi:hypothetical protein